MPPATLRFRDPHPPRPRRRRRIHPVRRRPAGRFRVAPWRKRGETLAGIRADIAGNLRKPTATTHPFVAEDEAGDRLGFLHLQTRKDFFTGALSCHIADLVVASGRDSEGAGSAMIAFAERSAREHRCRCVTLSVFPGNARARGLYGRNGYGDELIRMVKALK